MIMNCGALGKKPGLFSILIVLLLLSAKAGTNNTVDSVYIEAESGTVEEPMQVYNDSEASGGQFVMVQPGNESTGSPPATGKISLEINLNAGTYKIWGRVITPSGNEDSFWVQVDDGVSYRWNAIGEYSRWTWAAVHDSDDNARQVEWTLDEGVHTINFFYREEGARLDEVYITRFDDTPTKGDEIVTRTIHVSQELGSDANDGTEANPVKTLYQAYQIAQSTQEEVTNYEILLRGGETYDDFRPIYGVDEGQGAIYFGFVWDINRKLIFSTYGSEEKAHLLGSKHRHEGGPTAGLLVRGPSRQDVLVENLFFEMWQEGALMIFETEDVHARNIKINKIGTYYFPAEETPPNSPSFPYTAGVVYPKNSTRILMENIEMTNCHNLFDQVTALHGFYGTRLNQSEIRNCYMRNVSGSPFKFRRSEANNVYIHDNEAYYTGHTEFEDSWAQPGFLRYSGDPDGNCPFSLTFENNVFHYPFCWSEYGENCETAEAILCSVSNTTSCGEDACTNPDRVNWINNDIIYSWVPGQQTELPTAPFGLTGESVSENSITLEWLDININESAFVIERKVNEAFVEVARLNPNSARFTENGLNPSTTYEYRILVENGLGSSGYSEIIAVTTREPNRAPIPLITASALSGAPPLEVRFSAKESIDPDGDNMIYAWLVDGTFRGNKDTLMYTFEEEGTYTVTLILEDGRLKSETSVELIVAKPLGSSQLSEAVTIFPNPTKGLFTVSSTPSDLEVGIYTLAGTRVATFHHNKDVESEHILPRGVYIVVLRSEEEVIQTTKLVVRD